MKIDRLMGILLILSRIDKVTAPYLAEYFEVSKRTINRDIETLCMAGVPIITQQGSNGGISIQEGYKYDTTIFSKEEMTKIITGLNALDSVESSTDKNTILEKLHHGNSDINNIIEIELGSFYKETVSEKIRQIKDAVKTSKKISFQYFSKSRKSIKTVEPYRVVYKWQSWYLYAFSNENNDFRWYKLNRLWGLVITSEHFEAKSIDEKVMEKINDIFPSNYILKALFDKSVEYILVETYGNQSYTERDDGWLYFERDFTNFEFMLSWVLSFGDKVIVNEPICMIERIKEIAEFHRNQYE
ncbi:helix-turn-helix transcriptional regulator [Vallitalea guaymasensis]|uniref:helix-turn-helix transcriptional regulator n=1 Tax=Vallitalea guaymasensis TaxID=1185412 RepID=UPI00187D583F|nr:YafY family protein [Vallitalea guaymasensis]